MCEFDLDAVEVDWARTVKNRENEIRATRAQVDALVTKLAIRDAQCEELTAALAAKTQKREDYMPDYLRMCDANEAQRNRIERAIRILERRE